MLFAEILELGMVIIGVGIAWMVITIGMLVVGSVLMKVEEMFL